ncbi:MAG: HAD family phosphatase [Treponema sp.]|jgi:HAD superfamily hydrolase (TIGR01549 family)|nr:HAD family phosphatase [Treponema sp.]
MKIKGIIFDMDGVLIEAKEWHYEALNKVLALFGYEISRYDHLVTYDGLPTSDKLKMISRERGLPQGLHPYINMLKQEYTAEKIYRYCHPLFVHEFALSRLNAEGYKLAVASNSIRDTVDIMMKKANLTPYLQFSLSNQDVKKAKPDPEIYNTAIAKLGFPPRACLVVEDNKNGIQAAESAGANVMKVDTVYDVTYENIVESIKHAESGGGG